MNGLDKLRFRIAAQACIEEFAECYLICAIFIDIRDAQLRFPLKSMVSTTKDLPLLGNRADCGLQ